jgi:hypothetical protein
MLSTVACRVGTNFNPLPSDAGFLRRGLQASRRKAREKNQGEARTGPGFSSYPNWRGLDRGCARNKQPAWQHCWLAPATCQRAIQLTPRPFVGPNGCTSIEKARDDASARGSFQLCGSRPVIRRRKQELR